MNIMEIQNVQYAYDGKKKVLKGINTQMEQGKMYAILGPSGCGKTTLLSLLGGLDSPTSGQILYQGEDIAKTGLADHRRSHVAFIFQSVAIARALASDAQVILADEPTGNLDEDTAAEITAILKESAHKSGKCVVIVTHSNELAKEADVILQLRRGELQTLSVSDLEETASQKRRASQKNQR